MLQRKKLDRGSWMASLLLFMVMVLLFMTRIDRSLITASTYAVVLFSVVCHWYIYKVYKKTFVYKKFVKFIISFSIVYIINLLFVGNLELKQALIGTIVSSAVALLIFLFHHKKSILVLLFCLLLVFFVYKWFILGMDANELTINSRNYISYFLFLFALPLVFYHYKQNSVPIFLIPIVILIMSVLAIGRGGILMSLLFLVGWILMKIRTTKHRFLFYVVLFTIGFAVSYVIADPDFFDTYFSRFEERAFESAVRTEGWIKYVEKIVNPIYFIVGYPVKKEPYIMNVLEGSLHNSYLTLHARLGCVSFIVLFFLYKAMKYLFIKREYLLMFFLGGLLLKGFTDADFPCTGVAGDTYIYILILIYLETRIDINNRNNRNSV